MDNTDTTYIDTTAYPLTKKKCLKMGGHCYERTNYTIDTNPPIYHRVCKHCGWVQEGTAQSDMNWEGDCDQPNIK